MAHDASQAAARPLPDTRNTPTLLPLGALMLAGMSLGAQAQSNPTPTTMAQQLPAVTVQATSEAVQDGYRATATRVGKTLQDPHDIPQAVTTVTSTLMEEQQVGSLREALRNVSGLTFNAGEGGRSGDNMNLRGFYTFGDMYLDGIRDTAQYNRETFNLEQIDVLRGSAAMLFGRGQAGGVINQVSKTPLLGDRGRITGSIGTDDYREITGDFNKQLGDNTALRLNLMKRDEGSIRENPVTGTEAEVHREGVGVSLTTGLYTDNQFTLNHYYLKTADNPDYGVPFDSATKRPSRLYDPEDFWGTGDTFDDSETNITSLVHQLRLSPKAELRTQLRYATYDRAYWAAAPSNTRAPTIDLTQQQSKTRRSETENLTLQSDLSARADLFGMRHELLAGFEYLKEDSVRWSLRNQGTAGSARYTAGVVNTPATRYEGETIAVYVQDTIEFVPNWKFTVGLRRDELDATYSAVNSPKLNFGETSMRTGLSWQPSADTHYYLSYSDSFSPTADLYQLSGGEYPPERSNVTELGAKWLLLEGDLALRAALFRAEKEWERNTDLESTAAILTKKRRTDGIEFELAGRITPKWEVFAGLALMDADILKVAENRNALGVVTKADPRLKGQVPRNTPAATFNLWSTYALGHGWKVGGGVEAKTERYAYSPSTANANNIFVNGDFKPNTAPAYARWDAMVAYEQPKWAARLNVKNLFDKVYYDQVYDNGGFTVPGTRRTVILSGEYKF